MRHVDVKIKDENNFNLGDIIATITGNNFGDQIVEYREYSDLGDNTMGLKTLDVVMNHEGSHWSTSEIINNFNK